MLNGVVRPPSQDWLSERGLEGFGAYWQEYDVDTALRRTLDDEGRRLLAANSGPVYQHLFSSWQGHATLDYARILREGFAGYRDRVRRGAAAATPRQTAERAGFYQALDTVMAGIEAALRNYEAACQTRAAGVSGAARERLQRLAAGFRRFLCGPPRDFPEALQLVHWMNALDGYDNVGRLDQYLHPFYERDLRRGALTPAQAEHLLAEAMDLWGEQGHWQVVVGGTDRDGRDASNELTRLILRARGRVQRPHPSVSLRLSTHTPPAILAAALDLLSAGQGQPAFYNDELYRHALQGVGLPPEAAAEFVLGGCSETHVAGRSAARDSFFNLAKGLEAVFYNGRVSPDGPLFGVETGPPEALRTYDEFLGAYTRQVEHLVDLFVHYRNCMQRLVAQLQPALIRTIFVSGCLETGTDHSAGGSDFDYGMVDVYGIPNVGNSLFAVRRLIYEERRVSMSQFVQALSRNFEGHEALLAACRQLPKYGNDQACVDDVVARVADHLFSYVLRQRLWQGDGYYSFCASAPGAHIRFGATTGATPDGRLAGQPLANSMGPMQGTDVTGPTAMLTSVARLPLWKCVGSPVVNLALQPRWLAAGEREAVATLVRTFFRLGGMQLQVNLLDRDTLRRAMEDPEAHRSLMVRVSGYSARFTELSRDLQEEILTRTVY
jgi:formate C-acetyltransferase